MERVRPNPSPSPSPNPNPSPSPNANPNPNPNPHPNPYPRYEQSVEGLRLVNYDTQGRPFRHTLRVTPVRSRSAHDVRPRAVGGRQ